MKKLISILACIVIAFSLSISAYAHSGRTDSNGGHKDNKNVSGLGSYHYHHGYSAHLHTNGICPYNSSNSNSSASSNNSSSSSSSTAPKTIYPSSIKITKPSGNIYVDNNIKIDYAVSPSDTTDKGVTWSSSNSEVATVINGTLYTYKSGEVTITAKTSNGKTDQLKINVLDMKLSYTKKALAVGETFNLKLTGSSNKISWSSSDKTIVTVSSSGKITGKSKGNATIFATINGRTYKCEIKVQEYRFEVEKTELKTNETLRIYIKGNTEGKEIVWSSSDISIATVNRNGLVTAKSDGTVKISAAIDGKKYNLTIKVVGD